MVVEVKANLGRLSLAHNPTRTLLIKIILTVPQKDGWRDRLGDEVPNMRDDLAQRKKNGQGFIRRHLGAWTTGKNWKVDKDNDKKEAENPAKNWG